MKTLYLDCGMGAAGDMLTAALYELLEDKEAFLKELNSLGIPGVTIRAQKMAKCGIMGTHMHVAVNGQEEESCDYHHDEHEHHHHEEHEHEHHHDDHEHKHEHYHEGEHGHKNHHHEEHGNGHGHIHHHHSSMHDIEQIVQKLPVSQCVKENAMAVYKEIAQAESHAHGVAVDEIHFHEVGAMDAIADVVAVCMLMEKLGVEKVVASPVHVGSGHVHCAHGILPVPAPATAYVLKDVPVYGGNIKGELCTPTGAALLKRFVTEFGPMPVMTVQKIGYGMGKKDFEMANCVRAMLGEIEQAKEAIIEMACNLDDMTPEQIGFAMERFFEAGALEVYTTPVTMKKSRPGVVLYVLCKEQNREALVRLIFQHTTTIGIREHVSKRYTLQRETETISTAVGNVRIKRSQGFGVVRQKYEYDDLARIANEKNLSIQEIINLIEKG